MTPPAMPALSCLKDSAPAITMAWPCHGHAMACHWPGHMAWPPAMLAHLLLLSMPGYCLEYLPEYLPGHTAAAKLRAPCCSGSNGIAAQAAQ